MRKTRILVLGNDPQINRIAFERLSKDVITVGINRIWLKHIPNYFFFNDIEIFEELSKNPEAHARVQSRSTCYSSDWLLRSIKKRGSAVPAGVSIYPRVGITSFPDSVTTAIQLFNRYYKESVDCVYYVAGVSLFWQEPSHFWKELSYDSVNKHDKKWYTPRFERMMENFKKLKATGLNLVSVNPNSNLNKLFRCESIDNLYSR